MTRVTRLALRPQSPSGALNASDSAKSKCRSIHATSAGSGCIKDRWLGRGPWGASKCVEPRRESEKRCPVYALPINAWSSYAIEAVDDKGSAKWPKQ